MTAEEIHAAWDWQAEANLKAEAVEQRIAQLEEECALMRECLILLMRKKNDEA